MKLICVIAEHRAGEGQVYNSGYHFARCARCGRDMIRTGRQGWQLVPRGHGVVWKSGRHSHSLDADFEGVLPELHEEAKLPATRPRFSSWCRSLARSAARLRAGRTGRPEEEEQSVPEYPRLMVLAVIVGSGFELLFGRPRRLASGR